MGRLAAGDFDVILPGLGRKDEIGEMALAVDSFKMKAVERARLEAEQEEVKARAAAAARKTEMCELADSFEAAIGNVVEAVSQSATDLEVAAGVLTKSAETTRQLSASVAEASSDASQSVRSVAAAAEQLAATVKEIGRQVEVSSTISGEAVNQAALTDARVLEQLNAANRIGHVVKLKGKTVAITQGDSLTQMWPLFLEKTGLKDNDVKTVAGDGQAKINLVISGQADLLLGYLMDQSMKIKDATGKDVYPIKFADYGVNLVSSGIIVHKDLLKDRPDLVRRFMAASVKSIEASAQDSSGAVDSILKALPKGGKRDTLIEAFELTIPLYQAPRSTTTDPFRVSDQLMTDTVNVLVQYGGLEAVAKDNPKAFYTNDYLPQ